MPTTRSKPRRQRKPQEPRRRWVEVPVPPTREMLLGMTCATFLNDGSLIEMERRFAGMLERLPKRRKR